MTSDAFSRLSGELVGDALLASQSGVFEWRVTQSEITLSSGLATLLGFPPDGFDGQVDSFLNILDPLDRERIQQEIASLAPEQNEIDAEFRLSGHSTQPRWFSARGRVTRSDSGEVLSILGLAQELPVEVNTERRMRTQQDALLELLANDIIDTLPQDEALAHITKKASATLALDRASVWVYSGNGQQLINLGCYDHKDQSHALLPPLEISAYPHYFKALQENRAMAIPFAPTDHRTSELNEVYLAPLGITSMLEAPIRRSGKTIGVVCHEHRGPQRNWTLDEQHFAASVADLVTLVLETGERQALLEALNHQSQHDSLTGLPNRTWLYDQLDAQIAAAHGSPVALLLFDIDRFKDINDTLGHNVGDQILIELASRLRVSISPAIGGLARLSGDEFGVILRGLSNEQSLLEQGQRLLAILRQPIHADGLQMVVQASCGIALSPEHGQSASTLFRQADVALYQAKEEGGIRLYQPDKDHNTPRRLSLMHDLILALEQGKLDVVFQPKYDLGTRELVGVEALSRWQHPTYGPINPEEFIPLAELGGLIQPLTLHVIRCAATLWKNWQALGRDLSIAVNLSPRQFSEPEWEQAILSALQETGMPASALELEITENAFIHEPARVRASMEKLSSHGVKFSIDDFGTGYSSLAHLSELPLHSIKIDRTFIRRLHTDPKHQAIIKSTTLLGQGLGLTIIAEGIEDEATAILLHTLGCHQGQGFHLGRPQSAESLLQAHRV
jgi:diguanylate cyclase (GGDEF)-like protein